MDEDSRDSRKKIKVVNKEIYSKTNDEIRKKLLYLVNEKNYLLKDAAHELNINYSTAKTIIRIWRIEKRICKKYGPNKNYKCKNKIFKVVDLKNRLHLEESKCNRFTIYSENEKVKQEIEKKLQTTHSHLTIRNPSYFKLIHNESNNKFSYERKDTSLTETVKYLEKLNFDEKSLVIEILNTHQRFLENSRKAKINLLNMICLKNYIGKLKNLLSTRGIDTEKLSNMINSIDLFMTNGYF